MKHIKWDEFKFGIFFLAIQTLWLLASMYRFITSGGSDYEALGMAILQGLLVAGLLVPNKYGLYTACLILLSNIPFTLQQLGARQKTLTVQDFSTSFIWVPIYLWYFYKRRQWWGIESMPTINGALEVAPAHPNAHSPSPVVQELQSKAWFRFCKLTYGFGYLVSLAIVLTIGYSDFPVEYIDSNASVIRCANGQTFSAGYNSIYSTEEQLDSNEDEKAKSLCSPRYVWGETLDLPDGGKVEIKVPEGKDRQLEVSNVKALLQQGRFDSLTYESHPSGISVIRSKDWSDEMKAGSPKYHFIPVKAVRGGYATLFWGLGIVVLVGELIRRSFLYVVAGVPFLVSPGWFQNRKGD